MATTRGATTQRRLRLLPRCPDTAKPTLADLSVPTRAWGTPFRPGELPRPVFVDLTDRARSIINVEARRRCAPAELAVRVTVEAARSLDALGAATGVDRSRLAQILETCANESPPPSPIDPDFRDYVSLLRARGPSAATRVGHEGDLELLISPQMELAWRAAAGHAALADWISARVCDAPADPWTFEVAATLSGASIPEWAYASWLRLTARSSALPHART